jgi:hypothetical protein
MHDLDALSRDELVGAGLKRRWLRLLAIAAVLALAGYGGCKLWERHQLRAERADHVRRLSHRFDELVANLGGDHDPPEAISRYLARAIVSRGLWSGDSLCYDVRELASELDLPTSRLDPVHVFGATPSTDTVEQMCSSLEAVNSTLIALADQTGAEPLAAWSCDPTKHHIQLVRSPQPQRAYSWRRLFIRDRALVLAEYLDGHHRLESTVSRTTDGVTWETHELPSEQFGFGWTGDVLATLVYAHPGVTVMAYEAGAWQRRSFLKLDGESTIHAVPGGDLLVIGASPRSSDKASTGESLVVLRSHDRARTFDAPRPLVAVDPSPTIAVLGDQTVVALSARRVRGQNVLHAVRLGANDSKGVETATLSWPDDEAHTALGICSDRQSVWALVGARHLVVSRDTGTTWAEVADLGDLDDVTLDCAADHAAISARGSERHQRKLLVCTRASCGAPVEFPAGPFFAVDFAGGPALWLSGGNALLERPFALGSYRIDGKLTPDRGYTTVGGDNLPVLSLRDRFVVLRGQTDAAAY